MLFPPQRQSRYFNFISYMIQRTNHILLSKTLMATGLLFQNRGKMHFKNGSEQKGNCTARIFPLISLPKYLLGLMGDVQVNILWKNVQHYILIELKLLQNLIVQLKVKSTMSTQKHQIKQHLQGTVLSSESNTMVSRVYRDQAKYVFIHI